MRPWRWNLWSLLLLPYMQSDGQHPKFPTTADEWMQSGRDDIRLAIKLRHNLRMAKNVILFVGDGMGVSTVTAARVYKGQSSGQPGEETQLNFEQFPHAAFSKTYSVDKQVPDSAATSTAYQGGVKANSGTLGVDSSVLRKNCSRLPEAGAVNTIMDWAKAAGKWTGLVTTTRVTHATPAAGFAHSPERDWESDADMNQASDLCKLKVKDIARQLVEDNSDIRVILGGGRRNFMPNASIVPDSNEPNTKGRQDGRNLIEDWQATNGGPRSSYVWNKDQLDNVDVRNTDFLLGLFSQSHMEFDLIRDSKQPSLAEMVSKAIGVLSNNPRGFFLLVEGGRIDHAHHLNRAHLALGDTVALDLAVGTAINMTAVSEDDTLMVVTADHSHVFTMGGYPDRGHDILGLLDPVGFDGAMDDMPYTSLTYANGPGPGRINLTGVNTASVDFQQSRVVPLRYETHSGEDVPIYARGPMAHLFHGVHEQSYIAHVMAYAACIGPYQGNCPRYSSEPGDAPVSSTTTPVSCRNDGAASSSLAAAITTSFFCVSVVLCLALFSP